MTFTYKQATHFAQREYLTKLLEHTHNNIVQAARIAGVNRATLYALLKRLNVPHQHNAGYWDGKKHARDQRDSADADGR